MELESGGPIEAGEMRRLSRAVRAGWRLDRVDSSQWDLGPAQVLEADPRRIVARDHGELAGAVAVAPDAVDSRLYGRDTWRISALVASDEATEMALLIAASEAVADRDLVYYRFSEIGEEPAVAASGFTAIGRGVTLGRAIDPLPGTEEAERPRDPEDRAALLAIARESAGHPAGTDDAISLERSRAHHADLVKAALARPELFVVTRDAARVTGLAALSRGELHGCIDILGVSAASRRRGFGTKLLAAADAVGRREGWRCLLVATSRANVAARGLYASAGFRELGDIVLLRRPGAGVREWRECTGTGATEGRDG